MEVFRKLKAAKQTWDRLEDQTLEVGWYLLNDNGVVKTVDENGNTVSITTKLPSGPAVFRGPGDRTKVTEVHFVDHEGDKGIKVQPAGEWAKKL